MLDDREGERIARQFAQANVPFLANHGVIVRGPNVAWAFDDGYDVERAGMHQVLALGQRRPLKIIAEHVDERTARQIAGERQQSDLHLRGLRRLFGF